MTEYDVQLGLLEEDDRIAGDLQTLVKYIFEAYPEAKNNNKMLYFYFWLIHNGMKRAMKVQVACPHCDEKFELDILPYFERWYRASARDPATIGRRQREIHMGGKGTHLPSPEVQEDRKRKEKAGPVKH